MMNSTTIHRAQNTTVNRETVVALKTAMETTRPNTREEVKMTMKEDHSAVAAGKAISLIQPCIHI